MLMKSLFTAAIAGGMFLAAGAANATVATYTTTTAYNTFGGGGTIGISDPVDWGQFSLAQGNGSVNNSSVQNGSTMNTANSQRVTATNGTSTGFTVFQNGMAGALSSHWNGDFTNSTNVLFTNATSITLSFSGAVTGFGIDAQTAMAGAFGFTIQAYSTSGALLATATNSGTSTGRGSASFGSAPFAGVTSTAGDISYVTITATGPNTGSGFAIDTSLIYHFASNTNQGSGSQQTPEPGTIALLGAGLVALGAVRRRRNRA